MSKKNLTFVSLCAVVLAAALMIGCGSNGSSPSVTESTPQTGQVVTFGTDAPICDVESFVATITAASLVSEEGGAPVPLITSASPATVDFARLTDFTNIFSTASVTTGSYSQLQLTLSNPQLYAINTAGGPPPTATTIPVTLTATSFTLSINNGPLVVSGSTTSGLLVDLNLRKSLQVDGNGQVTGTVDPHFTVTAATTSGSTVGEADSLYGVVGTPSTSNLPSGFTGSFPLTVADGMGQTYTILTNGSTVFEGDGVTDFSQLTANTFVEVDAIVNTSGQIIAQTVDSEEQVSSASEKVAFLGRIIGVTRTGTDATAFTLLVDDEHPNINGSIPLHSGLNVTLTSNTKYHTNWQIWNRQAFTYSPSTLGMAQNVAVYGLLGSGSSPSLTANHVFLRPRNVMGNFTSLLAAGSNGKTGGFAMMPCGALFGGNPITVLTYADTNFTGVGGLVNLTTAPTLNTRGVLFYEQTSGSAAGGAAWTAPTWVLQARQVHQLPN
jgi:hypothetical protein